MELLGVCVVTEQTPSMAVIKVTNSKVTLGKAINYITKCFAYLRKVYSFLNL